MARYAVVVALYGLKQALNACFEHFASVVTAASFSSAPDSAIFCPPFFSWPDSSSIFNDMIISVVDTEYILC